ncbi:LSM2 [Enterospora canceri]|uniref:LSM2 n=1 Tax=Enterospora canceri TaxID=1081671 RepID=A0A1Y1S990_9MICR|nr:LSM2 [Enterospora canceri]
MIYFEYFKSQIERQIVVHLKNRMVFRGILRNVDPFLNIKLDSVQIESDNEFISIKNGIKNIKMCSIRGSAIKCIEMDRIGIEERLTEASRLRYNIDR